MLVDRIPLWRLCLLGMAAFEDSRSFARKWRAETGTYS